MGNGKNNIELRLHSWKTRCVSTMKLVDDITENVDSTTTQSASSKIRLTTTSLLLGALPALCCNCCLTQDYRVSNRVRDLASSISTAHWCPSTCRISSSLTTLARFVLKEVDVARVSHPLPLLPVVVNSLVTWAYCHLP